MHWKPKDEDLNLVLVNTTMLAPFNEEKCKYCGRYGCTDRGITLTAGDPPIVLSEAEWAQKVNNSFAQLIDANKEDMAIEYINYSENQCVRKLKKSNAEAVLEKMKTCNESCTRNCDCSQNGVLKSRTDNYQCPFRGEKFLDCKINVTIDDEPLICRLDDREMVECPLHEKAFKSCSRTRLNSECYDLNDKLGASDLDNTILLMLSHRFSAARCRFSIDGICHNTASEHNEGVCTLTGLMTPCELYQEPEHDYTEGVCTYVSSLDGKDDRKIFNSSDYAYRITYGQAITLCLACRISHSIAKATGLKCLGVRRAAKNVLFTNSNPLKDNTIQINYLYMTHPDDVAKFNSELIAQAVYKALTLNCQGLGCEEVEECNFIRR